MFRRRTDNETVHLSRQRNEIILRAFWVHENSWQSKLVGLHELSWLSSGRAFAVAPEPHWHEDFLARWRGATGDHGTPRPERGTLLAELADKLSLIDVDDRILEEADIDSLINCLLSLLDGHPVGSRQKNLVEVLNTFLNVERRHRFARLIRRFAELAGRKDILETRSVRSKLAVSLKVAQDDPQSLTGRIALALFPEAFASRHKRRSKGDFDPSAIARKLHDASERAENRVDNDLQVSVIPKPRLGGVYAFVGLLQR